MYAIEQGIPCPKQIRGRASKYPYHAMKRGDSFFVPGANTTKVYVSAAQATKRIGNGHRFTCRAMDGGVRVWRVA